MIFGKKLHHNPRIRKGGFTPPPTFTEMSITLHFFYIDVYAAEDTRVGLGQGILKRGISFPATVKSTDRQRVVLLVHVVLEVLLDLEHVELQTLSQPNLSGGKYDYNDYKKLRSSKN